MDYLNMQTGVRVNLDGLTEPEIRFYQQAVERFLKNINWFTFHAFAFSSRSPLFKKESANKPANQEPLYLALKDMWLQLGVQQGMIRRRSTDEEKATA